MSPKVHPFTGLSPFRLWARIPRLSITVSLLDEIKEVTLERYRRMTGKPAATEEDLDLFVRWCELQTKRGQASRWVTVNDAWLDYRASKR